MLMPSPSLFLREPKPRSVVQFGQPKTRSVFLARLRDEIAILSTMGFEPHAIARTLGIMEEDVRALGPKTRRKIMSKDLTRRAVHALLHGRYARLGGRTLPGRAKHLAAIARAYTREELLCEPGIGSVTASEIEIWLEARGLRLRPSEASVEETREHHEPPAADMNSVEAA